MFPRPGVPGSAGSKQVRCHFLTFLSSCLKKAYSFLCLKPTFLSRDEFVKHLLAHFTDRGKEMFLDGMDIIQRNGCKLLKVQHSVNP